MITDTPAGVVIDIRVTPRAGRTAFAGVRQDALLLRVAAPPVEGAANDAVIRFLAELLDVPPRSVRMVSGGKGRQKRVLIEGLRAIDVRAKLP